MGTATAQPIRIITNNSEKIRIESAGNVGIGTTSPSQKLHVEGNARVTGAYYDSNNSPGVASQVLVSTATGTDWVDGSGSSIIGGPYLPLAGNTTATAMTGDIFLANQKQLRFLTSANDVGLRLQSSGTSSFIDNEVGDMYIRQEADGKNIFFQCDNGSGGNDTYFSVRPSNGARTQFEKNTRHNDGVIAQFGNGNDFQIYHDGSNSYISEVGAGDLIISADNDLTFKDGSGNIMANMNASNSVELMYGNVKKFETTSTGVTVSGAITITDTTGTRGINRNNTGYNLDLMGGTNNTDGAYISLSGETRGGAANPYNGRMEFYSGGSGLATRADALGDIIFGTKWSGGFAQFLVLDSSSGDATFSNNVTASAVTATTFSGDLNGTINTVTTAVTKANATNDTTVATTAFVKNLIGEIPAGLQFEGTWNASTDVPDLSIATPDNGQFWIVSVNGSTNLSGITDWKVGDWAIWVEDGAGTDGWQKVDNSSVLDGVGTGLTLPLWAGSGTSNTLDDSIITQSNTSASAIATISSTSDYQLRLHSTNTWSGIQFDDDGPAPSTIWHNATYGTFALGGGGSNVSGKKITRSRRR